LGAGVASALFAAQYQLHAAQDAIDRYALDEAQSHLDLYLKVHFRSATGHLLAAQTARRREAYDEAEKHLATCLQLAEMTEAVALERVLLTAQQGDLTDMESLLKARTAPGDPDAALVLEALARGYLNRAWDADALACLNTLLGRQPRHPQALLMRAHVWERRAMRGGTEHELDALQDFEKVVEESPTFEARLGLAGTLYRIGRPWEAASVFEQLRQIQAGNPEVLVGLARCLYRLDEADEARRLLDAVLEHYPDHPAGLLERGRLAWHAGELADAEKWLTRAAEVAPFYDCEPRRLLCECLKLAHKDEDARRCSDILQETEMRLLRVDQRMLQANRDPHDVRLRYEIAEDLMRLGRESDAVATLFLVVEQQPGNGPAHAALADYFERTGQRARAVRHRRAGGLRPGADLRDR
jgi:hypothetical protein